MVFKASLLCFLAVVVLAGPGSWVEAFANEDNNAKCTPFKGTDWWGGDMKGMPITGLPNAEACCKKCQATIYCQAYVYRWSKCWLKNHVFKPSACGDCIGQNFFERAAPAGCRAVYGKDNWGGDIWGGSVGNVLSPLQCCNLCNQRKECVVWTWVRDRNICFLKKAKRKLSDCPVCVTGYPMRRS